MCVIIFFTYISGGNGDITKNPGSPTKENFLLFDLVWFVLNLYLEIDCSVVVRVCTFYKF